MGAWPGKFVIGLTGNIATGKSVARKMLEHLGAYGIDADALGHRAIARDAPGYRPVVDTFGNWILASDEQIDRSRLARLAFSDPEAMARLEAIVHPLVLQAIDILIRRAPQKVIVVEAIKLIETGIAAKCDAVWVTYAPPDVQKARLMQKRGMTEAAALQRINTQPAQEQKIKAAKVVIHNDASFEDTWRQISAAWQSIFPGGEAVVVPSEKAARRGELVVERARPRQAAEIATLITRLSAGQRTLSRADIMAAFGEKAYLILKIDGKAVGIAGWKVENLVARTDEVYLDKGVVLSEALDVLMREVERTSRELQCEISLLFLPAELVPQVASLSKLGYQPKTLRSLGVRAWQEAAIETAGAESASKKSVMLFKQLRQDRVLRPV